MNKKLNSNLAKRIIPCLDIKNGRTVKGINFENLIDAGDPVAQAKVYADQGADELVFLDISATQENRSTLIHLVSEVAKQINIPFTVGGGVRSAGDVHDILRAGADKISINSAAVKCPETIREIAFNFGQQCVVLAIDAGWIDGQWKVFIHGGQLETELDLFEWAKRGEELGAGEILFTSMNNDGTKEGYAIEALAKLNECIHLPIIASGGAGNMQHFADVFTIGKSSAALAASLFHFGELTIPELKEFLTSQKIIVR